MSVHSLMGSTAAVAALMPAVRGPVFWSYLRYSTKRQRWSDSERRQVEQQRARAADLGIPFVDKYRDLGVSSFRLKNRILGMLGQFLDDVRDGPPRGYTDLWPQPGDILGVENFDRISRAPVYDSSGIVREIIDSGVVLQVRKQPYTRELINAPGGAALYNNIHNELERAHSESEAKSIRGRETNDEKRRAAIAGKGIFAGNRGPVWLKPNENRIGYVLIAERARVARYIFELADSGHGTVAICKLLNMRLDLYPSFDRRKGAKPDQPCEWNPTCVGRLLRNRAAIGEWQPMHLIDGERVKVGEPVKDHYCVDGEPLIDYPLFQRVQKGLDGRKRAGGRRGAHHRNLVLGLGTCGAPGCGGKLRLTKGRSAHYLRCTRSRQSGCQCRHGFPYHIFEPALLAIVGAGIRRMIADLTPPNRPDYAAQIATIESGMTARQATIDAIFARYGAHGSDAARQAADRQIDMIGIALDDDRRALDDLCDKARMSPHNAAHEDGFRQRFEASVAQLDADDPVARRMIRVKLAHELRQRIDTLVLRTDRNIEIHLNDGRDGPVGMGLVINSEGSICGSQYLNGADGSPAGAFGAMVA